MSSVSEIQTPFFENKQFVKRLNRLLKKRVSLKKEFIIDIFTDMKKKNEELRIDNFSAIVDKLEDPYIIYSDIAAVTYMFGIKIWNDYINENKSKDNKVYSYRLLIIGDYRGRILH